MGVAPGYRVLPRRASECGTGSGRIDTADVDAADKGDTPVHHQQLAVVAVIDLPGCQRGERVDRTELQQLHTAHPQALEKSAWCPDCAHAVVDHRNLYPLCLLLQQRVGKLPPDGVVFDDVGLQVDMVGRRPDGGQHGRVGLRPVAQQADFVADHQRSADHLLLQGDLFVQNVQIARAAF